VRCPSRDPPLRLRRRARRHGVPQAERLIGRKEAEELDRTVGLVRERRIVEYIEAIGARLARAAGRSDIAWQWSVADEPDANAFALPGGYVCHA
jgi:predicted Zn-dependent protease